MEHPYKKIEKAAEVVFLIIGFLTILEYLLIQGMFTAPIMIAASIIAGVFNIILACVQKRYRNACFYLLLTVALNMGYFNL